MGDEEIIPNGSIHWSISHDEATSGGGRRRRQWAKAGEIESDGNESIVLGPGNDSIRGTDTIPAGSRPNLAVTLRFLALDDLIAAIGSGLANVRKDNSTGMFEFKFTMRANGNNVTPAQASGASPNKWAQVRVEW